ncbi:IMP cyclohydrolase [Desulfonatronovibrio hydrogenovorans]|uniref:IMP cyclohydrolase n=1 Tax=Desulfonatronovibrio hydrogenovorans TaxID=53245 RepID=UPI00049101BF|nr:IMP cyclohydrolase [Desulfonatronovibrio hydrogenovorans]
MQILPVKRALISVTHKDGLAKLARFLDEKGVEIVSTGGTARLLQEQGIAVTRVSDVTGFPEILGGRVKTLHPHIHAGILADKDDPDHSGTMKELGINFFDLVCVNLYDFARAVADDADAREAVEKIDIGGPALLRASAKNFHSVCVLPDPGFYDPFMEMVQKKDGVDLAFRQETAAYTFEMTSSYDQMISRYLRKK